MFERFFRGDAVRGTTQGSGLGLSIAKWIADRHHAVIDVVSFKGVGSRRISASTSGSRIP